MVGVNRRLGLAVVMSLLVLEMAGMAGAATFTVTNTLDSGMGSLRDAINSANATPTVPNTINFIVNGTITLGSTLPAIANTSPGNLTIDGSGQTITVDGALTFQILRVNSGATVTLKFLTLFHGFSFGPGGAIFNNGTLAVADSTLSGNVGGSGGAISNSGMLTVSNSTFSGNSSFPDQGPGSGGAIENNGTLSVTSSTFSNNKAASGGAIFNNGTMTVTNSTFSGNSAFLGDGTITNISLAHASFKSTILAPPSNADNCAGTAITDAGYNISSDASCGFSGTSVNNSTTLHLDPAGLANNGGPTQTIALESNSEAVDFIPVANCTDQSSPTPLPLTTDQRGLPRPDPGNPNFCDAGAFELQTMPFVLAPNSERLQIARSSNPNSDQVNMAFTFTENGFPTCDAADNAFNGFNVYLATGSCASLNFGGPVLLLDGWVVHTVNHVSYGTLFFDGGGTLSAKMVELPTPPAPACGEWTVNIEIAGIDSAFLGNGPFALGLRNPDGDTGCFEITNAIVGNQIIPPAHGVRRGARRGRKGRR